MGRLHLEASSTLTVNDQPNENTHKGNAHQGQFQSFLHSSPLPLESGF